MDLFQLDYITEQLLKKPPIHSFIKIGGGLQISKNYGLHTYPSK